MNSETIVMKFDTVQGVWTDGEPDDSITTSLTSEYVMRIYGTVQSNRAFQVHEIDILG